MTDPGQVPTTTSQVDFGRITHLGSIGAIDVQVAIDTAPWLLPIDMLTVSAYPGGGLGELGYAVLRAVPGINMPKEDLAKLTPEKPLVVPVRGEEDDGQLRLRSLILASARDGARSSAATSQPAASIDAVRRATVAVIEEAVDNRAVSLGLPLLGTGVIGFPVVDVAFEVVPVVRATLHGLDRVRVPRVSLTHLTFVCRDRRTSRAIERVWAYYEMLSEVRAEALDDDVMSASAEKAGVPRAALSAALDVPEEEIWRPCRTELAQLRSIDRELDDVNAIVAGTLERERDALLQDAAAAQRPPSRKNLNRLEHEIQAALKRDLRWRELTKQREMAQLSLRAALKQESLLPRLLQTINNQLEVERHKSRETRRAEFLRDFEHVDTRALRAEPKPGGLVPTAAHERLKVLTDPNRHTKVSIGVAGPRGCGKSTLLREITLTWFERTERSDALRIFVPAPASYASRDFLAHLYSQVCEAVLNSDSELRVRVNAESVPPARLRSTSLLRLALAPALLLLAGIAAFAASTVWTAGTPSALRAGGVALVVSVAVSSLLYLFAAHRRGATDVVETALPPTQLLVRPMSALRLPSPSRVLVAIGIGGLIIIGTSSGLITARNAEGLILIVIPLITVMRIERPRERNVTPTAFPESPTVTPPASAPEAVTGLHSLDYYLHIASHGAAVLAAGAAQCTALIAGLALVLRDASVAPIDGWLVLGAVVTAAATAALVPGLQWHRALVRYLEARAAPPGDSTSYQARRHLDKMRYQRSVSSGWTSTVKLAGSRLMPLGVEAAATGSITEADVPLSVPEIVSGITTLLADRGPAVLAIDELDKIESVEEARRFLNDIKGIFEAQNTCVLVSMSEDAIARFERRGLPFRDVFDSAFDEVVRVPYLTADEARQLLNQRVTGVPEPLLALAFCQSGGLPRDLLRAAQQLIEIGDGRGRTPPDVVREAVHSDMASKVAAVTAAMRSITVEPDVSAIIRWALAVDTCSLGPQRGMPCLLDDGWLEALGELSSLARPPQGDQVDQAADRRELLRLGAELVGYLYYCRTLMELFCGESDEDVDRLIDFVDEDGGRELDKLAQTRQNFTVNPFVAWRQLDDVRKGRRLPVHPLPSPFVVAGSRESPARRSTPRARPLVRNL
ncbi:hypothetical protein GCM10027053_26090 [Intrasporangium mesophilum]